MGLKSSSIGNYKTRVSLKTSNCGRRIDLSYLCIVQEDGMVVREEKPSNHETMFSCSRGPSDSPE